MSFQSRSIAARPVSHPTLGVDDDALRLTVLQRLEALKGDLKLVRRKERSRVVEDPDPQKRNNRHLGLVYVLESLDGGRACAAASPSKQGEDTRSKWLEG